jgi:hypothetical protein
MPSPIQRLSAETESAFEQRLAQARVPTARRPQYHKSVRLYGYFCQKFGYPPTAPTSLGPFLTKLAESNQSVEQRHHAATAVRLLLRPKPLSPGAHSSATTPAQLASPAPTTTQHSTSWEREYRDLESAIRLRNYSSKTLSSYRLWVAKFQTFVRSRPTGELDTREVRGFLSALAVQRGVSASSQNQAFNALLFFFRHVLGREFGKVDGVVRAKRHRYVPVVLSRAETEAVLGKLEPPYRLVGLMLYGCGLRLSECVNLRIHCFNLEAMLVTVHDGKGQKDRTVGGSNQ